MESTLEKSIQTFLTYTFTFPLILFTILTGFYVLFLYLRYKSSNYSLYQKNFFKLVFNKGLRGEFNIFTTLEKFCDETTFLIPNIYIPKNNDETTEIDMVLVSLAGIFVIESKNYAGSIYGSIDDKNWTQVLPGKKSKFLSPLIQNQAHINALSNFLELDKSIFKSIIVFSDNCTLNLKGMENFNGILTKKSSLRDKIKAELDKEPILNFRQCNTIAFKLSKQAFVLETVKSKHIENVQRKKVSS